MRGLSPVEEKEDFKPGVKKWMLFLTPNQQYRQNNKKNATGYLFSRFRNTTLI